MDDTEKIQEFLARVYAWLDASYEGSSRSMVDPPWPPISVHRELRDVATAAWHEYERDYPLRALQARAAQLSPAALTRHGLYGKQLEYKLAAVDLAARFAAQGMAGWLRKLLELIDNLLESILKALNVDDALKEIKDALLASLPDGD
jgi:hypothetical protein